MARRKKKRGFGAITRDRKKVEAALARSLSTRGRFFPEHAKRKLGMFAEVYRVRGYGKSKLYQGWVCLAKMGSSLGGRKRGGNTACGQAKGATPTGAIAAAARDFARTLKGR